jgi:hypothetical protein
LKALGAFGALVVATLALAAGLLFVGSGEAARVEAVGTGLLELSAPSASPQSCKGCGWIESRREDQYTVRMRDGTSRIFDETPGVRWRIGERLTFIE